MLDAGQTPAEVAQQLRVTRKSVLTWQRERRAGGDHALLSKGPGGDVCRLDADQLEWLKADLAAGPAAFGWTDDQRWTAARVAELV